jgi:phosphoglycerate dehydrogenase-like enzyme
MRVVALRRNPDHSKGDRNVDQVFGMDQLNEVMAISDYLVVALPLTSGTRGFIKESNLRHAKKGLKFINVGRGPLVDEAALVRCLKENVIAGAALDVFTVEPLPKASELWDIPTVLISPHNCDMLHNSRANSVTFFTQNCARFLAGEELECIVDKHAGY